MNNPSAFLATLADAFGPPAERGRHDRIARAVDTISDGAGFISQPYRAESMLERLERRGDISHRERRGGEEFARLFRRAHHDPLHAADMLRGSPGQISAHGTEAARRSISASLDALGGLGSPCGSAAWFVLGHELSVRQWAMREGWKGRALRHETATGILRGTLGVLAAHFGT